MSIYPNMLKIQPLFNMRPNVSLEFKYKGCKSHYLAVRNKESLLEQRYLACMVLKQEVTAYEKLN